eukprot:CAMPEP_0206452436 /NCGR_PEP_ID=MMETSP0324_2-20121206/19943_1 /ASSEMBLY_ACC=CAM_ASM_000836 /TAXON_ID=2866 /ORGANISM="Crypthecodinium cohnii, Strain Seligo" /LENGTH=253 /DNA_ID=CAMNT_0053922523 /DNA_START=145 /DNA_END=906 /DNA_ORIENTATION=+
MLRIASNARNFAGRSSLCRPPCEPAKRRSCQVTKPLRAGKSDGISVDVEYNSLWGQIATFPKRRPFMTNIIVATVKTSLADLIVQTAEGKKEYDWKRNGVFTAFGFAYLGIAQWFIYVSLFTRLCPNAIRFSNLSWAEKLKDRAGQIDLVKQTIYDNFIHYTFVYFPVFYFFKELIQADSSKGMENMDFKAVGEKAMGKYWKNCVTDNFYMWSLWIPGDLLVYACPIWMRLPLNHAISLAWTMILSNLRGNEK